MKIYSMVIIKYILMVFMQNINFILIIIQKTIIIISLINLFIIIMNRFIIININHYTKHGFNNLISINYFI